MKKTTLLYFPVKIPPSKLNKSKLKKLSFFINKKKKKN